MHHTVRGVTVLEDGGLLQVSLCVKRLVYVNDAGETVSGVCSNFLCKSNQMKLIH